MREQVIVWKDSFEGIEFNLPDEDYDWSHKCSEQVLVKTDHLGILLGVFMQEVDTGHVDFLSDCDRQLELSRIKEWTFI